MYHLYWKRFRTIYHKPLDRVFTKIIVLLLSRCCQNFLLFFKATNGQTYLKFIAFNKTCF